MLIRRTVSTEQNRHKRPKIKEFPVPLHSGKELGVFYGSAYAAGYTEGGLVYLFHRSNDAIGMCGYDDVDTLKRFETLRKLKIFLVFYSLNRIFYVAFQIIGKYLLFINCLYSIT